MAEFIHLHNHSDYSLQDGAFRVKNIVLAAKENNMKAVAITDHGTVFSAIQFYKCAKNEGIKPIIGMEAYVSLGGNRFSRPSTPGVDGRKRAKPYNHLVLLAKNEIGYHNLCRLSSLGFLEGFYYRPRIDLELLRKYSEGLVCLSACPVGVVSFHLVGRDYDKAKEVATTYKEIFGDDFYLEIQNHNLEEEKLILEGMPRLAKELNIKLVATNDCHYFKKEHSIAHNVLLHVSDQRGTIDYKKLRYETDEIFFKSTHEMVELFKDYPQAIESTLEIADKCNLELNLGINYFPKFPIPENENVQNLDDYLVKLTYKGIKEKLGDINDKQKERLEYELSVIKKMGYSGYFLIVQDFIKKAKEKGIAVGPGRGSAAGSLVSYGLDITNVNPMDYDLLFERFLNPDRVSMPDIDCDFADNKRDEIIEYVKEKYGEKNVAQIITFSKLASKASLKDVGRVLGIPIPDVDKITKYIPTEFGKVRSIQESIETVPELSYLKNTTDDKLKELIQYAMILENMNRNISVHAAGVVISPVPLIDKVPLYYNQDTGLITQYDMKDLESIGLIKMDFLGLKTLTIIQDTIRMIKENRGIDLNIDKIPLDDSKTFNLFAQGKTIGVFQFDKQHIQDYLKKLKPTNISELSAMNALNRPGPMDFIGEFIERKHGKKKITYIHPKLESILSETFGIIIYQEQVIKIAHEFIGYTLAQADLMRRAMSKKDPGLMAKLRKEFVSEGAKHGIEAKICDAIYDEIEKFANYGFNKSHSVAYSILAFQTAYLKAHYPVEFLAANLANNLNKTDEISLYINECSKLGIPILPPDVNKSGINFQVEDKESIRFGLAAIKNVGIPAVEEIIRARQKKKFISLFDFCSRVDSHYVNKRALEGLIIAGAFDHIYPNRAELFNTIEIASSYGQKKRENELIGQSSIFDTGSSAHLHEPKIKKQKDWNNQEKMKKEREALGFFSSSHPLKEFDLEIRSFNTASLADYEMFETERSVTICAVILDIEPKIYQDNKTLARFKVLDLTHECDAIIFHNEYTRYKNSLKEYNTVIIKGLLSLRGDTLQIKVNELYPIESAIELLGKGIVIELDESNNIIEQMKQLKDILQKYNGDHPVFINLNYLNGNSIQYKLKKYYVNIKSELIEKLKKIIPENRITIMK